MTDREVEQMLIDNEKLIYFVINKYFPNVCHDEDIEQIGWIGLWKACLNFDGSKGKFSTFAVHCISNQIKIELLDRAKQNKFGLILSLDEPLFMENNHKLFTLADTVPDKRDDYIQFDYDLSWLEDSESERNIEIFKMWLCGYTMRELGSHFHLSRTRVNNIIKEIKERMVLQNDGDQEA